MTEYFLLDPYYKEFPQSKPLLFSTVYGGQYPFIGLTFFLLMICLLGILIMVTALLRELNYVSNGEYSRGVVTETCSRARNSYFYSYNAPTDDGSMKTYIGENKPSKNESCPQIGNSISVEYLRSQPKTARVVTSGLGSLFDVCLIGGFVIFLFVMTKSFLNDIREYRRASTRYERLKNVTTILDGKIFSVLDSANHGVRGGYKGYYIAVEYVFVVNNQRLYGTQIQKRDDLYKESLPQSGTPIRVLYADDNAYVML